MIISVVISPEIFFIAPLLSIIRWFMPCQHSLYLSFLLLLPPLARCKVFQPFSLLSNSTSKILILLYGSIVNLARLSPLVCLVELH